MSKLNHDDLQQAMSSVGPLVAHSTGKPEELALLRDMERRGVIDQILVNGKPAPIAVNENGPWRVIELNDRFSIVSDDFTHDVALSLSGNFSSTEQRRAYAQEVAKALNTYVFSGARQEPTY